MGDNEEATVRTLSTHRRIIDSLIEQHHGRFVNSAGDSVLAEFASVVNAVECAIEIQTTLKTENASLPSERQMEFRIGVNLGDVVVDGEQIYGDGINVAARLESLAEPGAICISGKVHEEIQNKLTLSCEDLGEQQVKNIAKPVRVFRVLPRERHRDDKEDPKSSKKDTCGGAFSRSLGWRLSLRSSCSYSIFRSNRRTPRHRFHPPRIRLSPCLTNPRSSSCPSRT